MLETSPKFSFPSFEGFERFEFNFFKKGRSKSFLSIKSKGRQKIFKRIRKNTMKIKILGSGCLKCQKLEENARKAVQELGLKDVKIEHIYEIEKIIEYGVMSTPAIVIDEKVKAAGRIPDIEEIKSWLK